MVKLYGLMGSGVLENRDRWETPKKELTMKLVLIVITILIVLAENLR